MSTTDVASVVVPPLSHTTEWVTHTLLVRKIYGGARIPPRFYDQLVLNVHDVRGRERFWTGLYSGPLDQKKIKDGFAKHRDLETHSSSALSSTGGLSYVRRTERIFPFECNI